MKATVPTDDLRRIVEIAARGLMKRGAYPLVLNGIHLALDDDGTLTATGSDIERTLTATCRAEGGDPGAIVVPGAVLAKVLGKVKADSVTITVEDGDARLRAGRSKARLSLLPVAEWPRIPDVGGEPQLLDDAAWGRLGRVALAASTDQQRAGICAVQMQGGRATATDSYRLHACDVPEGLDALVPAPALNHARQVLDGPITVTTDHNHARFASGTTAVLTRLSAGEFPDNTQRFFDAGQRYGHTITFDVAELLDALEVAQTIPTEGEAVRFQMRPDAIEVTQANTEVGFATTDLDAVCDVDLAIGFNPTYLRAALAAVAPDGGEVTMRFEDANKPPSFAGAGVDVVLMTVRL